jgi:hypothetical protein
MRIGTGVFMDAEMLSNFESLNIKVYSSFSMVKIIIDDNWLQL